MLKVELHCHTDHDPYDYIPYSIRALIDRAARLRYQALAVTLHDRYFDPTGERRYAAERGITLVPGIERTIERKHVLLLNFPAVCERVQTFADLADLRVANPRGLVVAPHPFYPNPSALKPFLMNRYADLFDAVEVNALWTRLIDFNAKAITWAREHDKPLVGNSDLHILSHLGHTYSLVDAEPDTDSICEAIRAGRVEVRTRMLSPPRAAWVFARMLALGAAGRTRRLVGQGNVPPHNTGGGDPADGGRRKPRRDSSQGATRDDSDPTTD